jgi:hypothetical protein
MHLAWASWGILEIILIRVKEWEKQGIGSWTDLALNQDSQIGPWTVCKMPDFSEPWQNDGNNVLSEFVRQLSCKFIFKASVIGCST